MAYHKLFRLANIDELKETRLLEQIDSGTFAKFRKPLET